MMTRNNLRQVWWNFRKQPAWLSIMTDWLKLAKWQQIFLMGLEDGHMKTMGAMERAWTAQRFANSRKPVVDEKFAMDCRKRFLEQECDRLRKRVAQFHAECKELVNADAFEKALHKNCNNISEAHKTIRQYQRELAGIGNKDNKVSADKIERARACPIEVVANVRNNSMMCPFHGGSMWVKKGFGYCFSCHRSLDAIGFMMHVKGLDFKSAVEALQ